MRVFTAILFVLMLSACQAGPSVASAGRSGKDQYVVLSNKKLLGEVIESQYGPRFLMRSDLQECTTADDLYESALWFPSQIQADRYIKENHVRICPEHEAPRVLSRLHASGLPATFQVSSLQTFEATLPPRLWPDEVSSTWFVYLRLAGQSKNVAGFLQRKRPSDPRTAHLSNPDWGFFDTLYVRNERELIEAVRAGSVPIVFVENDPDLMNPGEAKDIIENARSNRCGTGLVE